MATSAFVPNPRGLDLLLNAPEGQVGRFMLRTGIRVENLAKAYCPVDTGRLRASIGVSRHPNNVVSVGSNVEYAAYVELGTRYQRAKPYLKPALDNVIRSL
jgi:HK97 gp10 family phage protein